MPSEKFSARLSIAARLTPALSRRSRIAADDLRHGLATARQPFVVERIGNRLDMACKAALSQQGAAQHGERQKRQRTPPSSAPQ